MDVRVAKKRFEAEDIVSFEFVAVNGAPLPPFSAGAHVDVYVLNGMIRQYSLCNSPSETHRYVIAVLRDPKSRGGSTYMHDAVYEGDLLSISAPRNHFPLVESASKSILIAGGIGVTPILCMAERLAQQSLPFEMHYCSRSLPRTAFVDRVRQSAFADRVASHFDDGAPEQHFAIDAVLKSPEPSDHLYVCGPSGFLDYVLNSARRLGWPETNLHREYFNAVSQIEITDLVSFDIEVASTGQVIAVPPEKTVVQALAEHGITIPVSCEQGVCGTCLTKVLAGEPFHRDMFLTDAEHARNDQFTPCCSRSKTARLVLDL